jgi:hypothetical protein
MSVSKVKIDGSLHHRVRILSQFTKNSLHFMLTSKKLIFLSAYLHQVQDMKLINEDAFFSHSFPAEALVFEMKTV